MNNDRFVDDYMNYLYSLYTKDINITVEMSRTINLLDNKKTKRGNKLNRHILTFQLRKMNYLFYSNEYHKIYKDWLKIFRIEVIYSPSKHNCTLALEPKFNASMVDDYDFDFYQTRLLETVTIELKKIGYYNLVKHEENFEKIYNLVLKNTELNFIKYLKSIIKEIYINKIL